VTGKLWEWWEPEVQACTRHLATSVLHSHAECPGGWLRSDFNVPRR